MPSSAGKAILCMLHVRYNSRQRLAQAVEHDAPESVHVDYRARSGIHTRSDYERLYKRSVEDPAGFWADMAGGFVWERRVRLCAPPFCSTAQIQGGK